MLTKIGHKSPGNRQFVIKEAFSGQTKARNGFRPKLNGGTGRGLGDLKQLLKEKPPIIEYKGYLSVKFLKLIKVES